MFEKRKKLITPDELKKRLSLSENLKNLREEKIRKTKDILANFDKRKVVIVGPCSADDEKSVFEYVVKLSKLSEKVNEKLLIMSRIHTAKPRSRNFYKGILHDNDDLSIGLERQRALHIKAFGESGIPTSDELLYIDNLEYLDDIVSYFTVGARTSESPIHRFAASGIDIPVGLKNPINGSMDSLINSLCVAQSSQDFMHLGYHVKTSGNEFAHAILRGGVTSDGKNFSNFDFLNIQTLLEKHTAENLNTPAVIIDVGHSNSCKNPLNQLVVTEKILKVMKESSALGDFVKGFMIESYLNEGKCDRTYGTSRTDACLSFKNTEKLILNIADRF
ncbi:MAG: 3-deoxy-7-phosphoheptulonate synthase [Firmicutes bacterium]|nr:3-deoxy-7-phosphoheptulonate synthase [Bacillota bacterium]